MNILIGKIGHETNTFSAEIGSFERWSQNEWCTGQDILPRYRGRADYLSGMIRAAEDAGARLIPTVAVMDSGPLIQREALDRVLEPLLAAAQANRDTLDGVCLALHGAGCAQGIHDIEVYILRQLRAIVGQAMPVTVSLDLHGNIAPEMTELANGLFGVKQYPHVDMEEAGHLAMVSLIRHIRGEVTLSTAHVPLPLLIAPAMGCTMELPMKAFTDHVAQYAREHGLIDATLFHGFPFADIPWCGASIVTVSGGDPRPAAQALASYLWENRNVLDAHTLSVGQAVDQAQALALTKEGRGYVVINETSDNPGGGTPCDGTWLLRELVARDVPRSILGYIHDPEIALAAHRAGVGGEISGLLGGKKDTLHGAPLALKGARVCALSDGRIHYNTAMYGSIMADFGRSARLRIGQVEVVVAENLCHQTLDNVPFLMVGADIDHYDIVAVKSSNHFKAYYLPRAVAIVTADPPGIHTANFTQLTYHNIRRPIHPLDENVTFTAQ